MENGTSLELAASAIMARYAFRLYGLVSLYPILRLSASVCQRCRSPSRPVGFCFCFECRAGGSRTGPCEQISDASADVNRADSHISIFVRSEEHTSELQSRFDLVC